MISVAVLFVVVVLLAYPLGRYLAAVFQHRPTLLDPVLGPVERGVYRLCGVSPQRSMPWGEYLRVLLLFNLVLAGMTFLVLMGQGWLPLNPDGIPGMSWDLAMHTAASFVTNTNQQHYSGQAQLSYFAHTFSIVTLQFVTPATGLVALVAMLRALFPQAASATLEDVADSADTSTVASTPRRAPVQVGNFYQDLTLAVTRVLLPLSFALGVLLASQGVPATYAGAQEYTPIEAGTDAQAFVPVGPVAAMVAIKQLGTNGGGWYGPNSAVPMENPTPLSNVAQLVAITLLPMALVMMLGFFSRRPAFVRMTFGVMLCLSVALAATAVVMEGAPNPAFDDVAAAGPNWEGKETRNGIASSALWGTWTTQTSNGSVNAMHDSFNPLGGMVPLVGMFINAIWGGVGVGLINFLVFVLLTVFLCGLMVGRTPEFYGRKLGIHEIRLLCILLVLQPVMVLGFSAMAFLLPGVSGVSNPGFHGVSQVVYEYTSAFANNGSGFEGLGDASVFWNVTTTVCLILGRFVPILVPVAVAASLASRPVAPTTSATLRPDTAVFAVACVAVITVITLLGFLPMLVLGPVGEQIVAVPAMLAGEPLVGGAR